MVFPTNHHQQQLKTRVPFVNIKERKKNFFFFNEWTNQDVLSLTA